MLYRMLQREIMVKGVANGTAEWEYEEDYADRRYSFKMFSAGTNDFDYIESDFEDTVIGDFEVKRRKIK